MAKTLRLNPAPENKDQRLDQYLSQAHAQLSRSQIKNLIAAGNVTVDGATLKKPGYLLKGTEAIELVVPDAKKLDLTPQEVNIRILYEDNQLAVLAKPAGLSVHPSTTEDGPTVVHGLLHSLKTLSSVGGVERPGIVHRIDKGTSGVLVVSKTDNAHAALSAQFKAHSIERRYWALVYGELSKKGLTGRIETFFGRNPTHRKKMTGKLAEGRKAITHWEVLESYQKLSLVECRLETGRTHQIRVHLSELGFPIVGDALYGDPERQAKKLLENKNRGAAPDTLPWADLSRKCAALSHQLLHARVLGFEHPDSKEKLCFSELPPPDFCEILQLLKSQALLALQTQQSEKP